MSELKPAQKPQTVDNIVITCMDYRYQRVIKNILMDQHQVDIDEVDRLAIGGSSSAVADGTLMPSLKIARQKHSAQNVYIFDHIDCGGFGGLAAFDGSVQKEALAHFESLEKAKVAISAVMPELVVVTYVVGLDGEPVAPATLN